MKLSDNIPTLFMVNDILILVIFFFCRVLMIPFTYIVGGRNENVPLLDVPFVIPRMCNIMCLTVFIMQLVWFWRMLKAAGRAVSKYRVNHVQQQWTQESNGKIDAIEVNSNHTYKLD